MRRWTGLLAAGACLVPIAFDERRTADAAPTPSSVETLHATGQAFAGRQAQRVDTRTIPRPTDAICLPQRVVDADPAGVLNGLMAGRYGPLGLWASADIGGATNIGGPRQWIFALGDGLVGPNDGQTMPEGAMWIHNAFLVQDNNCFWVEWGNRASWPPRSLIPDVGSTHYWPMDAYVEGDTMYQFVVQIQLTGLGLFDFDVVDTDLVAIDLGTWDLDNATIIEHGPWERIDPRHLDGIFNVETGTDAVVFGVVPSGNPSGYGMVEITDPADPTRPWMAWNGSSWVELTSPLSIARVMQSQPGDNPGIRPFEFEGRWYGMSFSWTPVGIDYRVMVADAMTGPYRELTRVPAAPLPGAPEGNVQYWHTLEGAYHLGDGQVLMQWANSGGIELGTPLRFLRPSFTMFDLRTQTADAISAARN